MEVLLVSRDPETKKVLSNEKFEVKYRAPGRPISAEAFREADVVIADIQMPTAEGLVDVVSQMKKLGDTPIVVLTQFKNVREATMETTKVVKAGAEAVMAKPIKPLELLEVMKAFASRQSHGEPKLTFADQLKDLRESLGLSRADLADVLDCSPKSIQDWEDDRSTPRKKLAPLQDLLSLKERMQNQFAQEEIRRWIKAPNKLFGMRRPVDILRHRDFKTILTVLGWIENGGHS